MLKYRDKLAKLEYQMEKAPKILERTKKVEKPVVKAEKLKEQEAIKAKAIEARKIRVMKYIDARYDSKKFVDSYATKYPNGEFSDEERTLRAMKMGEGIYMRHDVGLNYLVQEVIFWLLQKNYQLFVFERFIKSKIKGLIFPGFASGKMDYSTSSFQWRD
jgi:hypothetical protein